MEIINFVQNVPQERKFNLRLFQRKSSISSNPVVYGLYSPNLKSFGVTKVREPISVKAFFMWLGRSVSEFQSLVEKNKKKLLIVFLIVAGTCGLCIGCVSIYNYLNNFTGPLKMEEGDTLDIENLNKLMESFALDGHTEYDDSGNLLDVAANPKKSYTQPVSYQVYKVRSGDTISGIAKRFGLTNISTLISVNDIGNVRQLCAGQKLKIPSIDGIIYTVKKGDSLSSLVSKYNTKLESILDVNELSSEVLTPGQQLFLPGVGLDAKTLKTAMGDRFILPIQAKFRWSSPYGNRIDPIAGVKSFHTGTDMACPTGTPIVAAMSGTITSTGLNRVYGNYVIIDHGNGYQTLYAHMSKIIATKGQWVSQGTRIGLVGSTGYSTGPHLHFTVYKNGKMINPMSILK